ncbi:MAG: hypothetical protein Q4D61_06560 [Cardiobacteriaceae bacterium]|nr:hypothetical protein [Cardiobacteriaceae bacterium]
MKKMLTFLCLAAGAVAAADELQGYYRDPDPARAQQVFAGFAADSKLRQKGSARLYTTIWGAQILRDAPAHVADWCQAAAGYDAGAREVAAELFYFVNSPESLACLKDLDIPAEKKDDMLANPFALQGDWVDLPVHGAQDIDIAWTVFYASGKPAAVHKIVDFMVAEEEKVREVAKSGEERVSLDQQAAIWSTKSNMKQDDRIAGIVRDYVATLPEGKRAIAEELLNK